MKACAHTQRKGEGGGRGGRGEAERGREGRERDRTHNYYIDAKMITRENKSSGLKLAMFSKED